jgi:hypothetical protein
MRFSFLFTTVMLVGCTANYPVLVRYSCSDFTIGETDKAEVISKCGQPHAQLVSASGSTLNFILPGSGLQVFDFDANGILRGFSNPQTPSFSLHPYSGP